MRAAIAVGHRLAVWAPRNIGSDVRLAGFMDAAVHFVTQAVAHGELLRRLPGILKIKVVGLSAHRRLH